MSVEVLKHRKQKPLDWTFEFYEPCFLAEEWRTSGGWIVSDFRMDDVASECSIYAIQGWKLEFFLFRSSVKMFVENLRIALPCVETVNLLLVIRCRRRWRYHWAWNEWNVVHLVVIRFGLPSCSKQKMTADEFLSCPAIRFWHLSGAISFKLI